VFRCLEMTDCNICLEKAKCLTYPSCCMHAFCFDCIERWSEINNVCPTCKCEFKEVYLACAGNGKVAMQVKQASNHQKFAL